VNIKDLFDRVYNINAIAAKRKKQTVNIDISSNMSEWFVTDNIRICQILVNLLSNAIKFTPKGKNITLKAELKKDWLIFQVIDEGIGIPSNRIKEIFSEFEQVDNSRTRHYGGTGLGLAIVKRVTDLLNGEVSVESVEGIGSTFSLKIPYFETKAPKFRHQEKLGSVKFANDNVVLVAEDNFLNQEMIKDLFEMLKVKLFMAENGADVVKMANELRPDVILMDIQMPGMDGIEAAMLIKNLEGCKDIPIVALSGDAFDEQKKKAIEKGFDEYLIKPLVLRKLTQVLLRHLRIRS
ncbi:MAG: response regulator, partial [Proteobacteria bacterium]|nr:response regulator [Pseudomonadota bacterium]